MTASNLVFSERSYRITGVVPLIQHNEQLADPLNRHSKLIAEISSKRKKTDADLEEMSRREWFGGLYLNSEDQVVVPSRCLERMLRDAAAKSKQGKQVQAGCRVTEVEGYRLQFKDWNKTPDQLWDSGHYLLRSSVKVGQSRVIRSRPIFSQWSLEFTVDFDDELVNARQLDEFVHLAGRVVGLNEWRPKHGRFTAEVLS